MLTKILITDSSDEFRFALEEELRSSFTVRSCQDGLQALELLRSYRPDFLVMDLMIPGIDGLTLLQKAKQEGLCPPVLVTTSFVCGYIVDALQQYNVAYMILKPCELSAITSRISDLAGRIVPPLFFQPSAYSVVTSALMELGIPTKRGGFHFCREAILMLGDNPSLQVTKHIYPELAKAGGCKAEAVEKSIRDVIVSAYEHRNDAAWRRYFSPAPNGQIPRPSNRMFLSVLSEVLFSVHTAAK